jgi:hypothetical protein
MTNADEFFRKLAELLREHEMTMDDADFTGPDGLQFCAETFVDLVYYRQRGNPHGSYTPTPKEAGDE